jgi:hypothetical protein
MVWSRLLVAVASMVGLSFGVVLAAGAAGASSLLPSSTSVSASPSGAQLGQSVTLKASVSVAGLGGLYVTPTGTITFTTGSITLGSGALSPCLFTLDQCTVSISTSALPLGDDTVTASFSGDSLAGPSSGQTAVDITPARPGAPTLNTATGTDYTSGTSTFYGVALGWTAPSSNGGATITSYNVYRSASGGGSFALIGSTGGTTSYLDTTAVPETTYDYEVTAVNSAGAGPDSNVLANTEVPGSSSTQCTPKVPCSPGIVGESSNGSAESLSVTATGSSGTLSESLTGVSDLACSISGDGGVPGSFLDSSNDQGKTVTVSYYGPVATTLTNDLDANDANGYDTTACFGWNQDFNGWYPNPKVSGSNWTSGPFVYGKVPLASDGEYEGFLGSCANHGGYSPCGVSDVFEDGSPTPEIAFTVSIPACSGDPRVGH